MYVHLVNKHIQKNAMLQFAQFQVYNYLYNFKLDINIININ